MIPVPVNSHQLVKAAELLRAMPPTVVNGLEEERPAWLKTDPDDPGIVVFTIGIFSSEEHRINRRGKVEVPPATPERQSDDTPASMG